ncbi:MAG: hypothetical protein E6Q97_08565 [Desulfurellales bacterium]|nr:MAG: hypothetical protein E6Q97_08565 [Desulfurellales bacterium]
MKIKPLTFQWVCVQRHEDVLPTGPRPFPDLRYDVTLIIRLYEHSRPRWGVRTHVQDALAFALANPGVTLEPASVPRHDTLDPLWPMWANKDPEGCCVVAPCNTTYHFSPNRILAAHVFFARDAAERLHVRITMGGAQAAGIERDRPAQPYRRTLSPAGASFTHAERWRVFYPELSATLHGGSDSPHVHTLWLHLKDDPTDALAWDAFADAMEEEGIYTPTRERHAAQLIRDGLLRGCKPVPPVHRHPGLLWPGQAVKP